MKNKLIKKHRLCKLIKKPVISKAAASVAVSGTATAAPAGEQCLKEAAAGKP